MPIIAYRYGLLPPVDWGEDCQTQLFLANQFWNTLVQIEQETAERWQELFLDDPDYAALKTAHDAVQATIEATLKALRTAAWQQADATVKTPLAEAVQAHINERKALLTRMTARRQVLKPGLREALYALEGERRERVKTARQESGLFWSNYNAVIRSYNQARVRALKDGGRLHFHAFDGSGRFVNQIQEVVGPNEIFGGHCSQVFIEPLPAGAFAAPTRGARRHLQRTTLTVTVYTGQDEDGKRTRRNLTLPMIMHRPLPEGARIKNVEVIRRRLGARFEWSVVFFCDVADPPVSVQPPPVTAACGINFGWRLDQQRLRVATLIDWQGRQEFLYLPATFIERLEHAERLQSALDERALTLRRTLADWLLVAREDPDTDPDWLEHAAAAVRSRSVGKLLKLASAWRPSAEAWHSDWFLELEAWRKADKRQREEMENLRRKAALYRLNAYKVWAHDVAQRYPLIGVGQLSPRKKKGAVSGETASDLIPQVRKNRSRAAISELSGWLAYQASKAGGTVVEAKRPVSHTCYVCRAKIAVDRRVLHQICPRCGTTWDQDVNAAFIAMEDALHGLRGKTVA